MAVIRRPRECTRCEGTDARDHVGHVGDDGLCSGCRLIVENEALRQQLRGAVSREHAVQAIGWLSAEVAVHGAPSLGPEWLELWDRALTATWGDVEALDGIGPLKARIEALEIIAGANENTMRQWEGEAKRLRHELKGTVKERERLREILRAVLIEPDPIKRNQLAAPVLTNPGGGSIPGA